MFGRRRSCRACLAAVICATLWTHPLWGAVTSTGDVEPPVAAADMPGSSKILNVPTNGPTSGGVLVGNSQPGTLAVTNGWTLNSYSSVVANGQGSGAGSGSQFTLSQASSWNVNGDLDTGRAAAGGGQLSDASILRVRDQARLGTLAGSSGSLHLLNSGLAVGSVGVGVAGAGTLALDGSALHAGFIEVAKETTGTGALVLNGATVTDLGGLSVGIRGSGTLTIGTGTALDTNFVVFGTDSAITGAPSPLASSVGNGTMAGPGSVWHNSQGFIVAYNTRGSFGLSGGASLSTGFLEVSRYGAEGALTIDNSTVTIAQNPGFTGTPSFLVGTDAGSVGRATLSGPQARLTLGGGGFLEIGRHAASARLDVSGGATASVVDTIIGTEQDGTGIMNVSGAGTAWTASSDFEVARNGHGTLTLSGGAAISSLTAKIGEGAASVGSASLSDPGTRWTTSDALTVAGSGSGSLTIANGAAFNVATSVTAGSSSGGKGTINVSGGASLASQAQIIIGGGGAGTLTVAGGAHLDSKKSSSPTGSSALIGQAIGGSGRATVTGAGSLWTNDGVLNVGAGGPGTLTIDTGGRVESSDGVLARLPGSHGTVTLTGAGSEWSIQHALYVGGRPASAAAGTGGAAGPGGTAVLTVGAGSAVAVGDSVRLFSTASTIDVSGGGIVAVGGGAAPQTGGVQVLSAGTLSGTGTIKGNVANGGSVISRSIKIQGDYTQSDVGLLDLHVSGPSANDTLSVTGTAAVGGTLELDFANFAPAAGQSFRLLLSPAVSGNFGSVVTAGVLTSWKYSLTGDSKGLLLTSLASAVADIPGDINGDGAVNFADLLALAQHYGKPGTLAQGDFSGDGNVNFADLLILSQHYGQSVQPMIAPVPEPSLAVLLVVPLLVTMRRRNK